jgi:hypothetical protein
LAAIRICFEFRISSFPCSGPSQRRFPEVHKLQAGNLKLEIRNKFEFEQGRQKGNPDSEFQVLDFELSEVRSVGGKNSSGGKSRLDSFELAR